MKNVILIPARINSSRLPNKVIIDINGIPLIAHVVTQAKAANIGPVYVACDNLKVADIVEKYGAHPVLTPCNLASGSDRIFYAFNKLKLSEEFDNIINLQGDLPNISASAIRKALNPIKQGFPVGTLATKISNPEEYHNSNVVKIAMTKHNNDVYRALYFSRSLIPYNASVAYHHIGIYVYTKEALFNFVKFPPSNLEKQEKLEQLRLIENSIDIGVTLIDESPISIDTADDLRKARQIIA